MLTINGFVQMCPIVDKTSRYWSASKNIYSLSLFCTLIQAPSENSNFKPHFAKIAKESSSGIIE